MTQPEFQKELSRLASVFGEKAFGTERAALLWREVNDLPLTWFKTQVDELIGESRYAPQISEFRERASRARQESRKREWDAPLEDVSKACRYCAGTGDVIARSRENGTRAGFRCWCTKGTKSDNAFPIWGEAYFDRYELEGVS